MDASSPSSITNLSRRGLLSGLLCTVLAGSTQRLLPLQVAQVAVHKALPPVPESIAKPAVKLAKANKPMQLGMILSDLSKIDTPENVFFASENGKPLTGYNDLDERAIIVASMQKVMTVYAALKISRLPNIYRNAAKFDPNTNAGHVPDRVVSLDEFLGGQVTISEAAARLNGRMSGRHVRKAGTCMTVGETCAQTLQTSDNGAAEALADYCGLRLIAAGYMPYPGKIATGTRAFITWVNQQAQLPKAEGGFGLSKLFHMETVNGLPPYEALMDYEAFQRWTSPNKRRFGFLTADQHFRKRNDNDLLDDIECLPPESGIASNIHNNNYWSWLDGPRIIAALLEEFPDKLEAWLPEKKAAVSAHHYKSVKVKSGSSYASMGCLFGLAKQEDGRLVFAMTAGQPYGKRKTTVIKGKGRKAKTRSVEVKFDNRYKAFAGILDHCPPAPVLPTVNLAARPTTVVPLDLKI